MVLVVLAVLAVLLVLVALLVLVVHPSEEPVYWMHFREDIKL